MESDTDLAGRFFLGVHFTLEAYNVAREFSGVSICGAGVSFGFLRILDLVWRRVWHIYLLAFYSSRECGQVNSGRGKEIYFQKYKNSVETEFFTYVPELRLR